MIAIAVGINAVRDPSSGAVALVRDLDHDSVARRAAAFIRCPAGSAR